MRLKVIQIVVVCARTGRRGDITISVRGKLLELKTRWWVRFEMQFPYPRVVDVAGLEASVVLLVSSGAMGEAPAPTRGEGPNPPMLGEGGDKNRSSWWKETGRTT